ncbi:hypothetical protein [uncultured Dokdonia sp.]|uniref:hypothetical protein n=1 Tax=uncultured Dokdonia sp. TaxID=575653 RepID=UPI00263120AB|nr:hypothetical protein [uncultured Dokdonia sp.]
MKRFIKHIVAFIPFALIFYCIGICVFGQLMPSYLKPNLKSSRDSGGFTLTRLQEVKTVSDIDILFVGSSHTYHGFDTRIFKEAGLTTFNLGTSAQTPLQTKFLLERYLDNVRPKEIIFQVSPFIFAIKGVASTVDILSNDIVDASSVRLALKVNDINVYNALIYAAFEDITRKKITFKEKPTLGKFTYISGGYVETNTTSYQSNQPIITDFEFNTIQLEAFADMIALVENREIRYHLVYVPITKPLYTSISKHTDFESIMSTYGSYYNFNKTMSLDTIYFYDRHHLNKKGVTVFNDKVIEKLSLSK